MGIEATDGDAARLCASCGICCDGSLFGRVDLETDAIETARKKKLRVVAGGRAFEQPCSAHAGAHGAERACAIYDERPRACRKFVCRLLARHEREGGALEPRLLAVRRTRELLAEVQAMSPEQARKSAAFAELTRRLEEDFARA
jgi:Fe-S-cluster containining protein